MRFFFLFLLIILGAACYITFECICKEANTAIKKMFYITLSTFSLFVTGVLLLNVGISSLEILFVHDNHEVLEVAVLDTYPFDKNKELTVFEEINDPYRNTLSIDAYTIDGGHMALTLGKSFRKYEIISSEEYKVENQLETLRQYMKFDVIGWLLQKPFLYRQWQREVIRVYIPEDVIQKKVNLSY